MWPESDTPWKGFAVSTTSQSNAKRPARRADFLEFGVGDLFEVWSLGIWIFLLLAAWGLLVDSRALATEVVKTNATPSAGNEIHWSLKPVTRPKVPAVANPKWKARNPIDHFIF